MIVLSWRWWRHITTKAVRHAKYFYHAVPPLHCIKPQRPVKQIKTRPTSPSTNENSNPCVEQTQRNVHTIRIQKKAVKNNEAVFVHHRQNAVSNATFSLCRAVTQYNPETKQHSGRWSIREREKKKRRPDCCNAVLLFMGAHRRGTITPAPSHGVVTKHSQVLPVLSMYSARSLDMRLSAASRLTRVTVHPPEI